MDMTRPDDAVARTPRKVANDASAYTASTLKVFLADTSVLLAKTQACHCNAQGPGFYALHQLTEAQYGELFAALDVLAERVRALGVPAPDGLAQILELATLKPALGETTIPGSIAALAEDHAAMAIHAHDAAEEMEQSGDAGSHDLLVARILAHEKAAWLLRSHLPPESPPSNIEAGAAS
jgi:starvation-inducible DNA-binding protein